MLQEISKAYKFIKEYLKLPDQVILESATGPEVIVKGEKHLMFGSYNYLGLATNEYVKERAIETLRKYGVGSGGVRILTGTMDIHRNLEAQVATLTQQESAMTFPSGYGTNVGVIPGLVNLLGFGKVLKARKAVIFNDEYNHASIIDGCNLSEAIVVKYKHCDVSSLQSKIVEFESHRKLIITDGIFSMEGDVAPLDDIIAIAKKHDALVMVDDAHGFGAVGKNGAGTVDMLGMPGGVDINMGTFSKGIGCSGGFISGKKDLVDYLRITSRSYMFSDSISPAVIGAVSGALDYIRDHPELITKVAENSERFRDGIQRLGLSTLNSTTHIIPLYTGPNDKTIEISRELLEHGIIAPAVRWPAVAKDMGRIRFAMSSTHTNDQIDKVLEVINHLKTKFHIPPFTVNGNQI